MMRVGELITEQTKAIEPKLQPRKIFNYLGLENVESNTGDLVKFHSRNGIEVKSRSKIFSQFDVLYGRLRPNLNKVYIAAGQGVDEGICSTEFYVLRPKSEHVRPYLFRSVLASCFVSSVVGRFQTDDLFSIQVPVPPLDYQLELEEFIIQADIERRELKQRLLEMPFENMSKIEASLKASKSIW
jgi:restriction endonuclease S subunit